MLHFQLIHDLHLHSSMLRYSIFLYINFLMRYKVHEKQLSLQLIFKNIATETQNGAQIGFCKYYR